MMMGIRQGQSIRGSVVAAASLLMFCILIPRAARADIVHLKNGRAMEGMILEESPEKVVLQLPFGEIGFPRASVLRIDRGTSTFEEYLDLRLELQRQDGTASEWLELARWAEQEGLDHSAREATLVAARLDPGLPGLVPAMTALGYEYEENLAVWLPHDEIMRRRGYVLSNGRWLSPSQAVAVKRAQEAAVAGELERQRAGASGPGDGNAGPDTAGAGRRESSNEGRGLSCPLRHSALGWVSVDRRRRVLGPDRPCDPSIIVRDTEARPATRIPGLASRIEMPSSVDHRAVSSQ